jgi:hypothetical protein
MAAWQQPGHLAPNARDLRAGEPELQFSARQLGHDTLSVAGISRDQPNSSRRTFRGEEKAIRMLRLSWLKAFCNPSPLASIVLTALLLSPAVCSAQQPIQVFIFAGQSNASGQGLPGQLDPVPVWAQKPELGWTGAPTVSSDSGIRYERPTLQNAPMLFNSTVSGTVANAWCNYEGSMPGVAWPSGQPTGGCIDQSFYGPEVSFLARYRQDHPGVPLAAIKLGLGGTALNDWMPGGSAHEALKKTISEAAQRLNAAGMPYKWAGLIWMQGENGSSGTYALVNKDPTAAYSYSLRKFLAIVRGWTDANMPVAIGRISNSMEAPDIINALVAADDCRPFSTGYTPYQACVAADELRRSQQVVVGGDPGNTWWDNDNLPVNHAGEPAHWYHFTGAGYLAMGERAYAAFCRLVPPPAAGKRAAAPAH